MLLPIIYAKYILPISASSQIRLVQSALNERTPSEAITTEGSKVQHPPEAD